MEFVMAVFLLAWWFGGLGDALAVDLENLEALVALCINPDAEAAQAKVAVASENLLAGCREDIGFADLVLPDVPDRNDVALLKLAGDG